MNTSSDIEIKQRTQTTVLVSRVSNLLNIETKKSQSPPTGFEKEQDNVGQEKEIVIRKDFNDAILTVDEQEALIHQQIQGVAKESVADACGGSPSAVELQSLAGELVEINDLSKPVVVDQSPIMDSLLISHENERTKVLDFDKNFNSNKHEEDREANDYGMEGDEVKKSECTQDFHSLNNEQIDHKYQSTEENEDSSKVISVKTQSRLVQPPKRIIQSSPQPYQNQAESPLRPSSAMMKPIAMSSTSERAIKPPATRVMTRAAAKESVLRKLTSRTQSQPRPSTESTKTVSQPATPKIYRKVVAVSSKVGSFTDHKPQGGNVRIFSENRTYNVQSKIGSLHNVTHTPGGGKVQIENRKLDFKEKAAPKIDAKSDYVPPVPEKKIICQKLNWNAQPKIGSLENVKHKPAGGNVQILDQKLEWHATSKVGSRDNIKHKPGGGNVQIFDERVRYVSAGRRSNCGSLSNVSSQSRPASRATVDVLDL